MKTRCETVSVIGVSDAGVLGSSQQYAPLVDVSNGYHLSPTWHPVISMT